MSFDPVTFKTVEVLKRMISRLLLQFQDAPVLTHILAAFSAECQVFLDTVQEVVVQRSPLDAIGEQLESIGRIVGQSRIVVDYEDVTWFSPDAAGLCPDIAPAWVAGVSVSGSLLADDTVYRQLIEAKIFRNFTEYGSIPENQTVAQLAFGADVSFIPIGPMEVDVIIPSNVSKTVVKILTDSLSSQGNYISVMPYPPTLNICSIVLAPEPPFGPDVVDHAADIGRAALKRQLSSTCGGLVPSYLFFAPDTANTVDIARAST